MNIQKVGFKHDANKGCLFKKQIILSMSIIFFITQLYHFFQRIRIINHTLQACMMAILLQYSSHFLLILAIYCVYQIYHESILHSFYLNFYLDFYLNAYLEYFLIVLTQNLSNQLSLLFLFLFLFLSLFPFLFLFSDY